MKGNHGRPLSGGKGGQPDVEEGSQKKERKKGMSKFKGV